MQPIDLGWFCQLSTNLRPLAEMASHEKFEWPQYMALFTAKNYLDTLANSPHVHLRASRSALRSLRLELDQVFAAPAPEADAVFHQNKHTIVYWWHQLEPLLQGELSVQSAYSVFPKRAYDIELLITDATRLFGEEVRQVLAPIERYDIEQAGKCLAFEIPTAALFHIFRAADSVLRRYYRNITGSDPKPKMRNWGAYIRNLRNCGSNEKILSALEQMKELHRNPVIHPEAQVTIEEALSFMGIAESVMSAMVMEMTSRQVTAATNALAAAAAAVGPALPVGLMNGPLDDEQSG